MHDPGCLLVPNACPCLLALAVALLLASAIGAAIAEAAETPALLRVVNGDFGELAGLSPHEGAPGWYDGVPEGWESSAKETTYAIHTLTGPTPPTCNVSQLGFLEQAVSTLAEAADVVLTFDVSEPWQLDAGLGAAILDGARGPLAHSSFQAGRGQTLVAGNVPAGTELRIQFWALWSTTPGLDNVTVTQHAPGSQSGTTAQRPAASAPPQGIMGDLDAAFWNPPNDYRVVQYSGHEGAVMPVAKMREYGIGGVMLFLSRHGYLQNEEAWESLRTNIRLAKEAGMQVWVADDNGYPSGQAGGRVVQADPVFELRCLLRLVQRGEGQTKVRIDLPPGAEAFVAATLYPLRDGQPVIASGIPVKLSGDHVEVMGLEGPWALYAFAVQINNDEGSPARGTMQGFGTTGHYPNLLDPAAVARFVDLTHEQFRRRLGPLQGQIDVFYTNEPHLGTIWHAGGERPGGVVYVPWTSDLPRRFRAEHGYDLMPLLPALYEGDSDEARLVRRHFYQTVGAVFSENFTGRIARWAEAQGVLSGGHLIMEERTDMHVIGYGNFLDAIGDQQIPGCDVPMPDPGSYWNFWMPKLISSAAQLRGRERVSVLIDPIIDRARPCLNPAPERMMRIVNMAYLTGANQVTSYIFWDRYTPDVYRRFNENVGRLAVMLRGARNVSNIAMYYPIETFQSLYRPTPKNWVEVIADRPEIARALTTQEDTIRSLFAHGLDFSWLDAGAVLGAEIRDGRLVIGAHEYTSVIMPRVELLPIAVVRKLQEFERAGGRVVWVDSLPRLGDSEQEHAQVRAAVASSQSTPPGEVVGKLGRPFPESFRLRLDGAGEGLFVGRYLRDGRRVDYVVNNQDAEVAPTLRLEGGAAGTVWVYDPADGSITRREVPSPLTMPPCSSVFVVE